jgi:tetratricopeptide (TPR) repeat protein
LDRALKTETAIQKPSLLIKRARLLEWAGDYEGSLETLQEVSALVSAKSQPRLYLMVRVNSALSLCHLGRYTEAEKMLPEIRSLTAQLGNELDALRPLWLEGRISAGLRRSEHALRVLSRLRAEFAARGIAYDAALVTLELAVLYLERGKAREVKLLAREMAPIFVAQGVHREALAALKLFCEAAENESVTVELAQKVVAYLHRARHNPSLRFEEMS